MVAVSLFLSANLLVPFIIYEGCFYTYIVTTWVNRGGARNTDFRWTRTCPALPKCSLQIGTHILLDQQRKYWDRDASLKNSDTASNVGQTADRSNPYRLLNAIFSTGTFSRSVLEYKFPACTIYIYRLTAFFPCATVDLQLGFCTRFLAFFSSTSGNLKARKSAQCWCINWQRTKLRTPCHSQKHCIKPCCLNQTAVIDSNKT